MVVTAPILEELVFRGYFFHAWRNTRLGAWGTILVTALLFALLHVGQYDFMVLSYIFVLGILLGLAREKTGSILTPVVMHMVNNAYVGVAMIYVGVGG